MNKKGASFGTVVAVLGSILIALGFAWLIMTNWHSMPSFLKLLILVLVTAAAYTSGTLFRANNYKGIGGSLLVLGALFFTLTVMLIAQIFGLKVGIQGYANLLLISWIGVVVASYIFESKVSLIVGMIEFMLWVNLQYFAFLEFSHFASGPSFGMFALLQLILGGLFYGISLLHRSFNHKFARTYQFWSLFYVLSFAYALSFQMLLPMLWMSGFNAGGGSLAFIIIFAIIGLALFVVGAVSAIGRNSIDYREVLAMALAFILFLVLIASSGFLTNTAGTCYMKSCYDITAENSCNDVSFINCEWKDNYCREASCYNYYGNETACKNALASLDCYWIGSASGSCKSSPSSSFVCDSYTSIDSCLANDGKCYWENSPETNTCKPKSSAVSELKIANPYDNNECTAFNNKGDSCLANEKCAWRSGISYYSRNSGVPGSLLFFWIIANIIFILIIIGVIGYGYLEKSAQMINLGIGFFVLEIISRYIGFIIDYWGTGYDMMAFLFIMGGIILLFGGWGIERFRRKLLGNMTGAEKPNDEEANE